MRTKGAIWWLDAEALLLNVAIGDDWVEVRDGMSCGVEGARLGRK